MSKSLKIRINDQAANDLRNEVAESITQNGVDVACPYCGQAVTVHANMAHCPHCDKDFEVKFTL